MIKYELAKKLKDAGFPQKGFEKAREEAWDMKSDLEEKDYVYTPTLSELIEACTNNLEALRISWWIKEANQWEADAFFSTERTSVPGGYNYPPTHTGKGSTSEEAVANLWLALHETKE